MKGQNGLLGTDALFDVICGAKQLFATVQCYVSIDGFKLL